MNKKRHYLILFLFIVLASGFSLKAQSVCNCWVTRDSTFHAVPFAYDSDWGISGDSIPSSPLYQNDDGSTKAIKLPFNFCFWGTNIDSIYINNNGNISFGQAYSSYVPDGFPRPNYEMIAPFWGDVDTRPNTSSSSPSGVVYYKMTSDYLVVQWDSVGYYDMHDDKLNSFQVIISNGADSVIPSGNNVEFCYRIMQWTTGDASGGVNGFGGSAATVGANKGDGTSYVQFGLFDTAGSKYYGQYPTGPYDYDGVAWLNGKSFIFNTCSNSIPPIVTGISACDTITVCMGDTVDLAVSYLSPNSTDSTFSALLPALVPGVSIISNKPGNTDSVIIQIIGSSANLGYHTIRVCGYDNEHPPDTSITSIVLQVDSSPVGHIVSSADTICAGDSVRLSAVTNVSSLLWSTGQKTDSITVKPIKTTAYTLQIGNGMCTLTLVKNIVVLTAPTLKATSDSICQGSVATLVASGGTSYKWSNGQTTDSIKVSPGTDTTYWVIAKNACAADTLKVPVAVIKTPVITFSGNVSVCKGQPTVLTATGGTSYSWSNGKTTAAITVTDTVNTTYTFTTSTWHCTKDSTITVKVTDPPVVSITPAQQICVGGNVTLTATGGGTYLWSNSGTTSSITVSPSSSTTYSVLVSNGCPDSANTTVIVNTVSVSACCDTSISYGKSVAITASGSSGSYVWYPSTGLSCTNCPNPLAFPTETTTYTVTITDAAGCTASAEVVVDIECVDFVVPNVFTPNGDGDNDVFLVNAFGVETYSIEIFDRWGVLVYKASTSSSPWDGKNTHGDDVKDGVYYYIIKSTCGDKQINKQGFVQVIR